MITRTSSPPIGWPLLPVPDANGRLNFPSLEGSVGESIRVILSTRPGEQLMRPSFGAGLDTFLHEQNTLTTRRRIRDLVTQALERWERRIVLDRVDVREVPHELEHRPADLEMIDAGESPLDQQRFMSNRAVTKIRVEIAYRLRRTNVPQHMGLTMELES